MANAADLVKVMEAETIRGSADGNIVRERLIIDVDLAETGGRLGISEADHVAILIIDGGVVEVGAGCGAPDIEGGWVKVHCILGGRV
jgi:hypothetical protein